MPTLPRGTERDAPGALLLVQEFLNTPVDDPGPADLATAEAIRRDGAAGDHQPALAARYGVSRQLVSAILREKRFAVPVRALGSRDSTASWLAEHGFTAPGETISGADHALVIELRGLLLGMALANNGQPLPPGSMDRLSALAAESPLVVAFSPAGASLLPVHAGVRGFCATILSAVYDSIRDGNWARLKACPADRCQHVFFDTSRNRTATWCSMAICGNRTKVRAYQRRRRPLVDGVRTP